MGRGQAIRQMGTKVTLSVLVHFTQCYNIKCYLILFSVFKYLFHQNNVKITKYILISYPADS